MPPKLRSHASRTIAAPRGKRRAFATSRDTPLPSPSPFRIRPARYTGNALLARYESFLKQHALSPITIRNYLADLRAFLRWHSRQLSRPLRLVSTDLSAYRTHLCHETGHSTATVNRHLQSLRLFGRFLFKQGLMDKDPSGAIELLRNGNHQKVLPRTLTPAEVARLGDAIRRGRPSLVQRDFAIVQLMLQAGLRVHEVAALRMDDVVSRRRIRIVASGPLNGGRVVPLNANTARALRAYLATRMTIPQIEHVFVSQRDQPLSVRSIQRLVDTYSHAAGLKGVCAQSLRHTCAQTMLDETRDEALVARQLGHRSTRMLKRYRHT